MCVFVSETMHTNKRNMDMLPTGTDRPDLGNSADSGDLGDSEESGDPRSPRKRRCLQFDGTVNDARAPGGVALDLDGTIDTWEEMLSAYVECTESAGDPGAVRRFVETYHARPAARPGLTLLLHTLRAWKESGRIQWVAIFTGQANSTGRATFATRCLEHDAGTRSLFDEIIPIESCPRSSRPGGVAVLRDLSRLSGDPSRVALVTSEPRLAINGYVIGVPPYDPSAPGAELDDALANCVRLLECIFPA